MILTTSPVSLERFTFLREQNELVAEASSLPPFGRVYDDACDEGLTIVSHRTGREVVYAVTREERDPREGELRAWVLRPVRPADASLPTLYVFND